MKGTYSKNFKNNRTSIGDFGIKEKDIDVEMGMDNNPNACTYIIDPNPESIGNSVFTSNRKSSNSIGAERRTQGSF